MSITGSRSRAFFYPFFSREKLASIFLCEEIPLNPPWVIKKSLVRVFTHFGATFYKSLARLAVRIPPPEPMLLVYYFIFPTCSSKDPRDVSVCCIKQFSCSLRRPRSLNRQTKCQSTNSPNTKLTKSSVQIERHL